MQSYNRKLGLATVIVALMSCFPLGTTHVRSRSQLVEVSPGISVYEVYPEEVYYADGYHWRRSGERWERSSDLDRGYTAVEINAVPSHVREVPQGQYVHYRRPNRGDDRKNAGSHPSERGNH